MPESPIFALHEERRHGSQSFRCAYYTVNPDAPFFHTPLHWHEEMELIYFEKGRFALDVNMEKLTFDTPGFAFIRSGELHRIRCDEPCAESAVVFSPHLLGFVSNDEAQSRILAPLAGQELLLPRMLCPAQNGYAEVLAAYRELCMNLCDRMPDGLMQTALTADRQLLVKAGLLRILGWLGHYNLLQKAKAAGNENVEAIKTVLSYIHAHYTEKLHVRDLAALLNLNEQYFCRFFKRATGKSPIAYVNEYRIRRAIKLLEETSVPVTEICLACGFNNFGNFLREFRAQTGQTPQKYRKQRLHVVL